MTLALPWTWSPGARVQPALRRKDQEARQIREGRSAVCDMANIAEQLVTRQVHAGRHPAIVQPGKGPTYRAQAEAQYLASSPAPQLPDICSILEHGAAFALPPYPCDVRERLIQAIDLRPSSGPHGIERLRRMTCFSILCENAQRFAMTPDGLRRL